CIRHAASVRPEPGSNSPIKFVSGSKLANHLMIDSSTLSLFSFQRAFILLVNRLLGDFPIVSHHFRFCKNFFCSLFARR
ncbi:hypothetical protein P9578_29295, partial [Brevibacillus choshinensis]|uniref:hypothetical protein n=1 Tax=Brevibacillus choshinensis TaxID=54911 RepID=UPI002E1B544F|nr:hypothetical protein [Brevibacillus choshinensis]